MLFSHLPTSSIYSGFSPLHGLGPIRSPRAGPGLPLGFGHQCPRRNAMSKPRWIPLGNFRWIFQGISWEIVGISSEDIFRFIPVLDGYPKFAGWFFLAENHGTSQYLSGWWCRVPSFMDTSVKGVWQHLATMIIVHKPETFGSFGSYLVANYPRIVSGLQPWL